MLKLRGLSRPEAAPNSNSRCLTKGARSIFGDPLLLAPYWVLLKMWDLSTKCVDFPFGCNSAPFPRGPLQNGLYRIQASHLAAASGRPRVRAAATLKAAAELSAKTFSPAVATFEESDRGVKIIRMGGVGVCHGKMA